MKKHPLKSKTIWGVIIMLIPGVISAFGIEFSQAEIQAVTEALVTIFGAGFAVYGRAVAKGPLAKPKSHEIVPLILMLGCLSLLFTQTGCAVASGLGDETSEYNQALSNLTGTQATRISYTNDSNFHAFDFTLEGGKVVEENGNRYIEFDTIIFDNDNPVYNSKLEIQGYRRRIPVHENGGLVSIRLPIKSTVIQIPDIPGYEFVERIESGPVGLPGDIVSYRLSSSQQLPSGDVIDIDAVDFTEPTE